MAGRRTFIPVGSRHRPSRAAIKKMGPITPVVPFKVTATAAPDGTVTVTVLPAPMPKAAP